MEPMEMTAMTETGQMTDHGLDPAVPVVLAAVVPEPASVRVAPMAVAVVEKLKHLEKNGKLNTANTAIMEARVIPPSRWVFSW